MLDVSIAIACFCRGLRTPLTVQICWCGYVFPRLVLLLILNKPTKCLSTARVTAKFFIDPESFTRIF